MSNSELIEKLWQRVYSMTQSQSAGKGLNPRIMLPPRFDQDLLNNIAQLKTTQKDQQAIQVSTIRGQLNVAVSMNLIGHNDLEELDALLDAVLEGGE